MSRGVAKTALLSETECKEEKAKPAFKAICVNPSCIAKGWQKHFVGTCRRCPEARQEAHEAFMVRKAQRDAAREEFLVRQARRDARRVVQNQGGKQDGKSSDVSTEVGDDDCWTNPDEDLEQRPMVTMKITLPTVSEESQKEIRKLQKKLRDISKLEDAMADGIELEKLQQEKVNGKDDILHVMQKLEAGWKIHEISNVASAEASQAAVRAEKAAQRRLVDARNDAAREFRRQQGRL